MTWEDFTDRYSGDGRIRLAAFHTKPAGHDMIDCQATLAVADDLFSLRATATGPVAAGCCAGPVAAGPSAATPSAPAGLSAA